MTTNPPNELELLAARIRTALNAVTDARKASVLKAIEAGEALIQAKSKMAHGEWGTWLEKNCKLPERTAQRYMKLAESKSKLEQATQTKSATMADLTLKEAERLLKGNDGSGGSGENRSDAYDQLEGKLIKKLKAKSLSLDTAEAMANETIKKLKETVRETKDIAEKAKAKAA